MATPENQNPQQKRDTQSHNPQSQTRTNVQQPQQQPGRPNAQQPGSPAEHRNKVKDPQENAKNEGYNQQNPGRSKM